MNKKFVIISLCVFGLAFMALNGLVDDWDTLEGSADNLERFWNESLWPPNTDVWGPENWRDGTQRHPTGEICEPDSIQFFCSKVLFLY